MTSSLVGSEMCIRDRVIPRWRASLWVAPMSTATSWPLQDCAMSRTAFILCLLYTSDAADDM
eukprot:9726191-Prorocentrum_lima.AAC.1